MRIASPRRSPHLLGAASLALVACLGTGSTATTSHAAAASDLTAQTPTFVSSTQRPLGAESASATAADVSAAAVPGGVLPAADVLGQLPEGAECPAGMTRTGSLYSTGFEDKTLPETTYTKGWSVVSGGKSGSYAAKSVISASDTSTQPTGANAYWPLAIPYVTSPGGRTILRYAIKGSYPDDAAYVAVNDESGWAAPTSSWGTVTLDVTGAITASDANTLDIRFANFPAKPATDSTIYLDDIEVYTCNTPNTAPSRVRGDFTGDGVADVVTVNSAGQLQIWPGSGDFHLGSAVVGGTGWGGATWLGSPGDLNGDGRADLLARFNDGRLIAYYGDGTGHFSVGSKQVGTGWSGMTAILPMNDLDGDGYIDVLGRDAANNLRRYWFLPDGTMSGGTIIGTGFQSFTSLFSAGDYNGDGRWDVIGTMDNGDMRVYTTLPTGALWGYGEKIGHGWAFKQVTSPGDFNRDGRSDVLGVSADGKLYSYPVLGGGGWGNTVITGTGFGAFRLIM